MVCLGLEPGVAESCAQTNPLSYGGTPDPNFMKVICFFTFKVSRSNPYQRII